MKNKNTFLIIGIVIIVLIIIFFILINLSKEKTFNKILTLNDINTEISKLENINNPENRNLINRSEYPKIIGIDKRNGKTLIEIYDCRDLCPQNGFVGLIYNNITSKDECININGVVVDNMWPLDGQFEWCRPRLD